jgi:hypothetical protein
MQQKERKYNGGKDGMLDSDSASFAVAPNAWVNAENVRSGTTDKGVTETIESIGNTVLISQPQPSINFIDIGKAEDIPNNRFCKFKFNTTGRNDKIVCYDENLGVEMDVLLSSQVVGGLNFSKESPIHSARVINGLLYWVDSTNNQPRKINIDAAILANNPSFIPYQKDVVAYIFPINFSEITIIKPPPIYAPSIVKAVDNTIPVDLIFANSFEFSWQYVWYDNETTVLGMYSISSKINAATDIFNVVQVTMSLLEQIPESVRIVNLIVRIQDGTVTGGVNSFIINTWDKQNQQQAVEILSQNLGITSLNYNYYYNNTGTAIGSSDVLRPFDNVPIFSESMETAKDLIFPANNTEGYDTPNITSLTASVINTSGTTYQVTGLQIIGRASVLIDGIYPYATYTALLIFYNNAYYAITSDEDSAPSMGPFYDGLGPVPPAVPLTGIQLRGNTILDVINYAIHTYIPTNTGGGTITLVSDIVTANYGTTSLTGIPSPLSNVFIPHSIYFTGICFYDFAKRKCGVVTNSSLNMNINERDYSFSTGATAIQWGLDNSSAINEIPDWAYWYAPLISLNQKTRFFIESVSVTPSYVTKDSSGNYVYNNSTFSASTVGIALDTLALIQAGLGYVFNDGDIATVILSNNNTYYIPVIAQDGNYIILKAQNIGTLITVPATPVIYNVYTPYQTSQQEPYYEIGQIYPIISPTTINRNYRVLSGNFLPDSFVLPRVYNSTTYLSSAMSPNDYYYKRWDNNIGMSDFITALGQVVKTQYTSWSDPFIPNTAVNGLSTFRVGNEIPVPQNCGAIQKLILTSKVSDIKEGNVMLAICTNEASSMYLGENQISDSQGQNQFFSSSTNVIGTINTLKGSSGTINPESVCEYRGKVWWYDAINGRITQYAENGLFFISSYKMTRFWKNWSLQYNSMTAAQIEALGSRPFIFMVVDPAHDELLISIPKLSNTPPQGYLPDYPDTIYPFDILDYQAKTIVFKLEQAGIPPHWQGAFTMTPEGFVTLNNQLFSFKNGLTYLHNQTNGVPNTFYGTTYLSKIMFLSNANPSIPKVYNNIQVQANMKPFFVYLYNLLPEQQASDLVDFDFRPYEGILKSPIYRNKLIPTFDGYTIDGLLTGQKMRNVAMFIMIQFNPVNTPLELKFIDIDYDISRGNL